MSNMSGNLIYKYTFKNGHFIVQEGVAGACGPHYYVKFESCKTPERVPTGRNLNRVWKGGEVLWLTERDDERAKQLFTEYGVKSIEKLEDEIDKMGEYIKDVRKAKFEITSRCVNSNESENFGDVVKTEQNELTDEPTIVNKRLMSQAIAGECERQYKEAWNKEDFADIGAYVDHKLHMLQKEMFIVPSLDELAHLRRLTTQTAVDNAVHSIIDRAWGGD